GPAKEPGALHLLLALLADRASASHRALLQAGVEIARLRASAIQLAIGAVAARRVAPAADTKPQRNTGTEGDGGGHVAAPKTSSQPVRARLRGPASRAPSRADALRSHVQHRPARSAPPGPGVTLPILPPAKPSSRDAAPASARVDRSPSAADGRTAT